MSKIPDKTPIRAALIPETSGGSLKPAAANLAAAALASGAEAWALCFGGVDAAIKEDLQKYGVSRIVEICGPGGGMLQGDPETRAQALARVVMHFEISHVLGLTSTLGRDLLPRAAAILDSALALDCLEVDLIERTALKPVYSNKVLARIKLNGSPLFWGLRPESQPPEPRPAKAALSRFEFQPGPSKLKVLKTIPNPEAQVDLGDAHIIISGGRALNSADNFRILENCAEVMGAAVGASRAAVDAGYAPFSRQVGQTGKTVNPRLYLACGISGAIQHLAGMRTAGLVAAINLDPDAEIFKHCDYGLVADLFETVPLLTQEIARLKTRPASES